MRIGCLSITAGDKVLLLLLPGIKQVYMQMDRLKSETGPVNYQTKVYHVNCGFLTGNLHS